MKSAVSEDMAQSPLTQSFSIAQTAVLSKFCSSVNSAACLPDLSSLISDVQIESVARYFGGNGYKPDEVTTQKIHNAIAAASQLVSPMATYTLMPVSRIFQAGEIMLDDGKALELPECFTDPGARVVATVIGTLGERLENHCRELAGCGKIYESTLFDAIGTTLLDLLSDRLYQAINEIGREVGLTIGDRFAPGIDGYPLEQQRQLFQMVDSAAVGVGLNSSAIMEPTKSISFFMILTKTPSRNSGKSKCSVCRLTRCQYRTTGSK